MRIARSIAVVGVTTIAVFGLTACGGDSDPKPSPSSSTSKAATEETKDSGSGDSAEMADWVSAMEKTPSYRISMDMGAEGKATGLVDMSDAANPKMSMDMSASGQTIKMIMVDKKMYMNMGALSQNKYVVYDTTDGSAATEGLSDSLENMDLSQQAEKNMKAVTSIEKKGSPVTIDGVSAQPYEVTIDTSKIASELKGAESASLPATLTYTYYIGPDNLPRRMVYSVAGSEVTMDLTDWGTKVDIQAPPASETIDAANLAG